MDYKSRLYLGEKMRDLSKLLWVDLRSDEERSAFIKSGMANKTGIIAPSMEEDIILAFDISIKAKEKLKQTEKALELACEKLVIKGYKKKEDMIKDFLEQAK